MKILLIMDPGLPVPPLLYGGHERLVYMFAEAYSKLGHEVTLLSGPESHITGQVYTFGRNHLNRPKKDRLKELFYAWNFLRKNKYKYELIHNFGRLAYLLPVLNHPVKKIMTYGRQVTKKGIKMVTTLPNQQLIFTGCSNYCVKTGHTNGKWVTVYNAIDFSKYDLQSTVAIEAPLIFLGRLDEIKGVHHAIEVAKRTNHKLIIAGNISSDETGKIYFRNSIAPFIDGKQIIYVGALNDLEKNKYLGLAKALLFPIEWDEPFGMVMIESMACGTPVIGFRRGSVPEVVTESKTGFIVDNQEQMMLAVGRISDINRSECRDVAYHQFDVHKVALNYLNLHQ